MLVFTGSWCKSTCEYMSSGSSKCTLLLQRGAPPRGGRILHPSTLNVPLHVRCMNGIVKETALTTRLHQGGLDRVLEHAHVPWGPLQDASSEKALANCCKRLPRNTKPQLLLARGLYRQHHTNQASASVLKTGADYTQAQRSEGFRGAWCLSGLHTGADVQAPGCVGVMLRTPSLVSATVPNCLLCYCN